MHLGSNRPPAIVFRTTAGKRIGFGHLRRCMTLAVALRMREAAASIRFLVDGPREGPSLASAGGFDAHATSGSEPATTAGLIIATGADILIVDAYDIDEAALSTWRRSVGCLAVIDDLADRFLDADLVINSSPSAPPMPYRTPDGCRLLLGVHYALLRPTFRDLPRRQTPETVSRVMVTLGGADPSGDTARAVEAVRRGVPNASVDVVVGPLFGPVPELDRLAQMDPANVRLHRNLDDLSELMTASEMAVSGGGQTLYEIAACGVPTIALCLADNQKGNLAALAAAPTLLASDWSTLERTVNRLATDPDLRRRLSETAQALVDGYGASRVADSLLALIHERTVRTHADS